jgi:hypothetical protein
VGEQLPASATTSSSDSSKSLWSQVKSVSDHIPPVVKHYGQYAMAGAAGAAVLGALVQYSWSSFDSGLGRLASALLGTQRPASPELLDVVKAYASVMSNYSHYGAAAGLGAAFKSPMGGVQPAEVVDGAMQSSVLSHPHSE